MLYSLNPLEFRIKILLGSNGRNTFLRVIAIVLCYGNMPVKCDYLLPNFLLQPYTCGNSNHHYHNTYCNCCDTNFYYWCRNTTFIRFTANNAFCYKIFVIQIFIYVVSCSQKYSFPDNYRNCFSTNFLWEHNEEGR